MAKLAESEGISSSGLSRINNVLMQMRKNCNHPDLITSAFTADLHGPPMDVLLAQSGKLALLDRLLKQLKARGHKVLIFSQVRPVFRGGGGVLCGHTGPDDRTVGTTHSGGPRGDCVVGGTVLTGFQQVARRYECLHKQSVARLCNS